MSSAKSKLLQGSASNLLRVALSMVVSLLLPRYLVHRMAPAEYGAWVLVLQLSAYVSYLDFGVQTAVGKYVAEYDALGDRNAARRLMGTAFSVLSIASVAGLMLIGLLAYEVPSLFRQMPAPLFHEVRVGLLCVGVSVCLMLPFSVFATAFVGLQSYGPLTLIQVGSRVLSALALVLLIQHGGTLSAMAAAMALFNVATGLAQVYGWKRYASRRAPFAFPVFDARCARTLAEYCGILSIWTVGSVLIGGLDTAIVGHFDFVSTPYYASAASATNFMLLLTSNLLGPMLPAVSSLQTTRTPEQMGDLLLQATRYGVATLLLLGLPLLVCGYPLLAVWLGHAYAARSVLFLEVLVAGNILRQLGLPYALFIVATGKQRYATVSPVAESLVNVILSVVLARHLGAIGVALGTLLAAFVGLAAHIGISMHYTRPTISVSRRTLVLQGVLRPGLAILPTLLLLPFWQRYSLWPANPSLLVVWMIATVSILWWAGLTRGERLGVRRGVHGRLGWLAS